MVRSILKKNKITKKLRQELLKPTKIYTKEILKLVNKDLINAAAHITGGGLVENLLRSTPENFSLEIDLSKILPVVPKGGFVIIKSKSNLALRGYSFDQMRCNLIFNFSF